VSYGWDSARDDTATLDAESSAQLYAKPDGDVDTSDETGSASFDRNGNGSDFMKIIASDVSNRAWDRQNQPGPMGSVSHETGHHNSRDYLNYNSYNEGSGHDTVYSAVNGTLQPTANATYKIDASGNSFLRVAFDNDSAKQSTVWRPDTSFVAQGHSQGNDNQFTELTSDYTVNGLITSKLGDDEVNVTGFSIHIGTVTVAAGEMVEGQPGNGTLMPKTEYELLLEGILIPVMPDGSGHTTAWIRRSLATENAMSFFGIMMQANRNRLR